MKLRVIQMSPNPKLASLPSSMRDSKAVRALKFSLPA